MNRFEKSILLMPKVILYFYFGIVLFNIFAPLFGELRFSVFQLLVCLGWIPGLLAGLGILVAETDMVEDDILVYEQVVSPSILIIGILRIVEALYFFIAKRSEINWTIFLVLVGADVLYLAILLFDKMRYSYGRSIHTTEED